MVAGGVKMETETSPVPKIRKHYGKIVTVEKMRDWPYLKRGARMIHMKLLGGAQDQGKFSEHAIRLKIFTSTLMRELLLNFCPIKYI